MIPKTIRRKKITENIRFDIFFDDLRDANEGVIEDYLVVVPKVKNKNDISGIGMLPVLNGKICLLKMYHHATETVLWEIPT